MSGDTTTEVRDLIERLRDGDDSCGKRFWSGSTTGCVA